MIQDHLEEQAALYAAGALSLRERTQFELVLEFRTELRDLVRKLQETAEALLLNTQPNHLKPAPALKAKLMDLLDDRVQHTSEPGFVMSGPDGLVDWVNPAFSAMCGYSLEELKGKKLGPILQGKLTDPATAKRMRDAVHNQEPCTEAVVNYHKNGTPYWVSINITPIKDNAGRLLWYVARELELTEREIAA